MRIYSVDTSHFYNQQESLIHNKLNKAHLLKRKLKQQQRKKRHLTRIGQVIKTLKQLLYDEFSKNDSIRTLNEQAAIDDKNVISIFDSALTRTLGIQQNELSTDIIVVQTYFFSILKDIIMDGFMFKGEKYVCFTASAGQIRTKKTLFIKESSLLKYQGTLMCGLTLDIINELGGVNINKYLAYLALCNSATDEWLDFDIDKTIVVEDMETCVRSVVDFIDEQTYEITRQEMDIPITHTDGCGMILPRRSKKSMMIRMPWIKGLLVPFPFHKFLREHKPNKPPKKYGVVKDIYGKEYNILREDIEVILTKSQFKMWKYYSSWDQYKDNFKKYKCQVGKCNEEEEFFDDAKISYQMLQTLTDMSDEELLSLCSRTNQKIRDIGHDRTTMLRVLGVTKANTKKNFYQQALEIYPELLSDTYSKEILKQVKKSIVREARAGKLDVKGKYTFISPDLYAFCEYLFLKEDRPNGLLQKEEVSCNLYGNGIKLDCLRSPHLYREHAIRINRIDKDRSKWFVTKGLYTSVHDDISKILMFDNDGDKALVCSDETLVTVAERNMKGIVPLFYNMAKAGSETIDNEKIYEGLITAYTGGNIGTISNDISKVWNSEKIDLNVIKWLCMDNNFVIDYAKTLYKPTKPEHVKNFIAAYTKSKVPHFFIYAKNKQADEVAEVNNSIVNRLEKRIPNTRLNFRAAGLGVFEYKNLKRDSSTNLDQQIIDKYKELDLNRHFLIRADEDQNNLTHIYTDIRNQLLELNSDPAYVVDVLVEYLYSATTSNYKTTLWECFGDVLVENLQNNIRSDKVPCQLCGIRMHVSNHRTLYCDNCRKLRMREQWKNNKRKIRNKNNVQL